MMSLGFFSDQAVAQSGETAFDVSAGILEKSLYSDAPDVVLVKAEAKQGSTTLGAWTSIIDADKNWTAMQKSTGASAAVIAELDRQRKSERPRCVNPRRRCPRGRLRRGSSSAWHHAGEVIIAREEPSPFS